ncbi:uncharacterized protein LOC116181804 [Photinus pyralis]|uniref:uncharacterized protein LOC116169053 n=1 Tax=Photinus pyralis TaxID=7054 RepID=UPI0012676D49|nr:uncharacterized protein LOC116169053 [Photinus pyralis]XP_031358090.1 uncharacterized protein LOC116181804 [Photinus pyralis]
MAEFCIACCGKSTRNNILHRCNACDSLWHAKCAGLSTEAVPSDWLCNACGEPTLKDIMKELRALSAKNSFITEKISACQKSIEDVKTSLHVQEVKVQEYINITENLRSQNASLISQVCQLTSKVNQQEQYSRANTLELHGIPVAPHEDILKIVISVGNAVNFKITPTVVDVAHRLRPRDNNTNRPSGIIIKFVRRYDKEGFLRAVKSRKNFSSHDLTDNASLLELPSSQIFAVESLSPYNKQLFHQCRQFKKDHAFKYLWTKNGRIFLRRADGENVSIISNEDELKKLWRGKGAP